jgi:rhodanese-related sulfurtransferase
MRLLYFLALLSILSATSASADLFEVPYQTARTWVHNDKVEFIDVREPFESSAEPTGLRSVKAPLSWLQKKNNFKEFLKRFGKRSELLVFYCTNGMRAKIAVDKAVEMGFKANYFALKK